MKMSIFVCKFIKKFFNIHVLNGNYVIVLGDMKKALPILVLELNLGKSVFVGSVDVEENSSLTNKITRFKRFYKKS
jgi:hypothetical protein